VEHTQQIEIYWQYYLSPLSTADNCSSVVINCILVEELSL